jgi:hypothetical protein
MEDGATQERRDGAVASGGFSQEIGAGAHAYHATWTGTFLAARDGAYGMELHAEGEATLSLDGRLVARGADFENSRPATVALKRGPHRVEITLENAQGPGAIEWTYTPPDGRTSVVPPSVLEVPRGAGVGPRLPAPALASPESVSPDRPLVLRW